MIRLPKVKRKREPSTRSSDSQISEIGMHDCRGLDGYVETIEPRPRGTHSPQQSFSDTEEGLEEAGVDPALSAWNGGPHDSDTNCSSLRSSAASSDGSFQTKLDFASAVAKAAKMSGLTVASAPHLASVSVKDRGKVKKASKHRQRARCTSPYSTDSNYSAVNLPHKPYPKSERRCQLRDHSKTQPNNVGCDEISPADGRVPAALAKSQSLKKETEVSPYSKPRFPNGPGAGRMNAAGPKLTSVVDASQSTAAGTNEDEFAVSPHSNPVIAFDTHNMPIA